jgi:hypothetical protein
VPEQRRTKTAIWSAAIVSATADGGHDSEAQNGEAAVSVHISQVIWPPERCLFNGKVTNQVNRLSHFQPREFVDTFSLVPAHLKPHNTPHYEANNLVILA